MKPSESLPAQLFLLAFDLRKERLTGRSELGYLLRAAALAELLMHGHLVHTSGKACVASTPADLYPASAAVWTQIAQAPPRSWRRWIGTDRKLVFDLACDELAIAGVIKVERRRVLGVFPYTEITLRRPYVARRLHEQVGGAIRGGHPVKRIDPTIRALAALAAAGELSVVIGWTERLRYKARLTQLTEPIEPVTTALHKTITAQRYTDVSVGTIATMGG